MGDGLLLRLFADLDPLGRRDQAPGGERGGSADQTLGVRMLRILQQLERRPGLDDATLVHDHQVLGSLSGQPQIVGDQQHRSAELRGEGVEVVEDLLLHRDVEGAGGLIGHQQLRPCGETHRDQGALLHAAGELVRVLPGAAGGIGEARLLEQLHGAGPGLGPLRDPVGDEGLSDLGAHLPHGVEVAHRVLRDQAHLVPTQHPDLLLGDMGDVAALEEDLPAGDRAVLGQQVGDRHGGRRLARSGLADDRDGLSRVHLEARAAHSLNRTAGGGEGDLGITDLQQRLVAVRGGSGRGRVHGGRGHRFLAFGSRASRTASPSMMKLSTVIASAREG